MELSPVVLIIDYALLIRRICVQLPDLIEDRGCFISDMRWSTGHDAFGSSGFPRVGSSSRPNKYTVGHACLWPCTCSMQGSRHSCRAFLDSLIFTSLTSLSQFNMFYHNYFLSMPHWYLPHRKMPKLLPYLIYISYLFSLGNAAILSPMVKSALIILVSF